MTALNIVPLRSPAATAAEELERLARRPCTPCRRELRDLAARFRAADDFDRAQDHEPDHAQLELEAMAA